ncbi:MAG: hypothetical protein H0W95_10790 [Nocardioidaceae bacterium]|nr:hypothetical protein [Nocardioidaceae bacterium]
MRSTYVALARLVALGVIVQAALIAFGWFEVLSEVEDGAVFDENTDYNAGQLLHAMVGTIVIPVISLVLLVLSFFAKIPGGVKWAAIIFGLVVLQFLLALVSFSAPVIGLLHGMNALALAIVAERAGARVAALAPTTGPEQPRTTAPA